MCPPLDAPFELKLPQVHVLMDLVGKPLSCPPPLLVLGGRAPDPEWLRRAAADRELWALDRGADICRIAELVPSRLLGDFDSISYEARRWAESRGVVLDRYSPDKDDTDFQLALKLLHGEALVTGCWGGRFDHAFSNIFSSLGALELGVHILCFADERELLFPLKGPASLRLTFDRPPSVLSLLSLTSSCKGVFIENVKWPLSDDVLTQKSPWTISNVPLGRSVTVTVREGVLGVYAECR